MKKELLRWDSNPRHTAYEADALPTELLRQLSWMGPIKAIQGKGNNLLHGKFAEQTLNTASADCQKVIENILNVRM